MNKANFFHSVTLDRDKCHGCINCVKRCPTEAIRVREGKARIIKERCIDCGECIRVCPHHAKQAIFDPLSVMDTYKYKVALPAPALYGQFNNLDDIDIILGALQMMGFDEVFEVARAAELVSDATRKYMARPDVKRPVISSACPAVLRLIRVRFPELIDNVLPLHAPIEVAARLARKAAMEKTGFAPEEIGVIFISPCPAKVTAVKMPLGAEKKRGRRGDRHPRGLPEAHLADEKRPADGRSDPGWPDGHRLGQQRGRGGSRSQGAVSGRRRDRKRHPRPRGSRGREVLRPRFRRAQRLFRRLRRRRADSREPVCRQSQAQTYPQIPSGFLQPSAGRRNLPLSVGRAGRIRAGARAR